jgi:glycosyltransferase involved in cell wall biosynthesis
MNERPDISIIVCTRNRAKYVGPCIKQLLSANTIYRFEVIVRDNCSEDNTQEVITELNEPRLRYVRAAENQGWSTFLEAGKLAKGEVITWISDEEDFIFENLEYVLNTFRTYALCNVLIGSVIVGPRSTEIRFPEQILGANNLHKAYLATLSFSGCSGIFVRQEAFAANCKSSFIDIYDAYVRQNFYQIGYIANCCLAGGELITTSRVVAKEVRHAPTTDNWSVANEVLSNKKVLLPHYYPLSILDRLSSSLATVWECEYMGLSEKIATAIELMRLFIGNINATSNLGLIALLSENYSAASVNAYKADIENRNLHRKFYRKLWILRGLLGTPLRVISNLKMRKRK